MNTTSPIKKVQANGLIDLVEVLEKIELNYDRIESNSVGMTGKNGQIIIY